MRFITWNMGEAFEQRYRDSHDRSWETLLGLNPDVAFVQESRRPSPDLVPEAHLFGRPRNDGGSFETLIYVKDPVALSAQSAPIPVALQPLTQGQVVAGWITTATRPWLIASLHAKTGVLDQQPIDDLPDDLRRQLPTDRDVWHMDLIALTVEMLRRTKPVAAHGANFLAGGDVNLAWRLDELHGPGSFWGSSEWFAHVRHLGWQRPHLKFHAGEQRTLFRHPHELYQLDHYFANSVTNQAVTDCQVVILPHLAELSDHAPVLLEMST
jgi:endonuclease/exonuclease/phosphatase family metal-dependent hydrolase